MKRQINQHTTTGQEGLITLGELNAIGQVTEDAIYVERRGDQIIIHLEKQPKPFVIIGGKKYSVKDVY